MASGGDRITIPAFLDTSGFKKGTQELSNAVKSLSNSVKRTSSQITRVFNSMTGPIKRLVPMLIGVGSAYGVISKAVSTFMSQNQRLQAQMTAVWTALGNLLGPIITQIVSWISTAVSYFIKFLNLIGVTSKTASQLSKKAQGSATNLQRTIAGFDELNVLNRPIYQGTLEDKDLPAWLEKLVELLKNKLWDEAADLIIDKINNLIYTFRDKAYEFGEKCSEYLYAALHIIGRVIDEVDWSGIGEGLANFINGLVSDDRISGEDLGKILVGKFTIAFKILSGFLETIDGGRIGEILSGVIKGALNSLDKAIKEADFEKIGQNIRDFFDNIDWEGIKTSLGNLLKDAWEGAVELLKGFLMGGDNSSWKLSEESAEKISEVILTALGLGVLLSKTGIAGKLGELAKKLLKVKTNAGDAGDGADGAGGGINKLGQGLKKLAKNLLWGLAILAEVAAAAVLFVAAVWALGELMQNVVEAWQPVIDDGTTALTAMGIGTGILVAIGVITAALGSGDVKTLATNIGKGTGILFEVGVAAALFIAEIWAIGELLQQIVDAWQPVIDESETVETAIEQGGILLVAIGVVTAALGTLGGGGLAEKMLIGLAILAEMSIATDLFLVEVWAMGELLQEIIKAWQPVLENAETVQTAIEQGTILLVAVAAVTAALGEVTIASGLALPAAIAVGTGVLWGISEATKLFISELTSVADKLANELAPKLEELNGVLPDLTTDMEDFTDFMEDFAGEVVNYSKSSTIISFAELKDKLKEIFLGDPIDNMREEAEEVYDAVVPLNEKLQLVNPELETAISLLTSYVDFTSQLNSLLNGSGENDGGGVIIADSMLVNMQTIGQNLVAGLTQGIQSKSAGFNDAATTLTEGFETTLKTGMTSAVTEYKTQLTEMQSSTTAMKEDVLNSWEEIDKEQTDTMSSIVKSTSEKFTEMVKTVNTNMTSIQNSMTTAYSGMQSSSESFLNEIYSVFSSTFVNLASSAYVWGADMIANFTYGVMSQAYSLYSACYSIAQSVHNILGFSEPKEGPLSDFHTYAPDMIDLFTKGINDNKGKTLSAVSELAAGISDEIQDGDYSFGSIGEPEVEDFMDGFADKVVNGFADMVARMQEIADSVSFTMPTTAGGGFLPYNVGVQSSDSSTSLESKLDTLLEKLSGSGDNQSIQVNTTIELDGKQLAKAIYKPLKDESKRRGNTYIAY